MSITIIYEGKKYSISDNAEFKKIKTGNQLLTYILFIKQQTFRIKGIAAHLFEEVISFNSIELNDIALKLSEYYKENSMNFQQAVTDHFNEFLKLNWIQEKNMKEAELWRCSRFTYYTSLNGTYFIMNMLYKTIDRISPGTYSSILKKEYSSISPDELFYLYTRKYIEYAKHTNEENEALWSAKNKYYESVYLINSYNCNLNCIYCFEREEKRNFKMNEKVLQKTFNYIDMLAEKNRVLLTFYGGEPLLEENRDNINTTLQRYMDNDNVYFKFITNGIYVKEYMSCFESVKNKIAQFVITLDGTGEIQNKRRILDNPQGSFDFVIKSICMLNEYKYPVAIRINIDRDNIMCQNDLILYLNQVIKNKDKVIIEYHRVEDKKDPNFCAISYMDCYNLYYKIKKISQIRVTFSLPVLSMLDGFIDSPNKFPYIPDSFCNINSNHVIDYDGKVYSCNEAMGNEAFMTTTVMQENKAHYKKHDIDKKCRMCSLYLACLGNCSLENYYYKLHFNNKKCEYKQIEEVLKCFLSEFTVQNDSN